MRVRFWQFTSFIAVQRTIQTLTQKRWSPRPFVDRRAGDSWRRLRRIHQDARLLDSNEGVDKGCVSPVVRVDETPISGHRKTSGSAKSGSVRAESFRYPGFAGRLSLLRNPLYEFRKFTIQSLGGTQQRRVAVWLESATACQLQSQATATRFSKLSLCCATKSRMFVAGLPVIVSTSCVRRS
jgi:hypothetical protein